MILLNGIMELIIAYLISVIVSIALSANLTIVAEELKEFQLQMLGLLLLSVSLTKTYVNYIGQRLMGKLAMQANVLWASKMLIGFLSKTKRQDSSKDSDEEIFNLHSVTSAAAQQAFLSMIRLTSDLGLIVIVSLYLASISLSALLTAVVLLCMVFLVFTQFVFPAAELYGAKSNNASQINLGLAKNSLTCRRQIHFLQTKELVNSAFLENGAQLINYAQKSAALLSLPKISLDFIAILLITFCVVLGTTLNLDIASMLSVVVLVLLRLLPLGASVAASASTMRHSSDSLRRLAEIFDSLPAKIEKGTSLKPNLEHTTLTFPKTSLKIGEQSIILPEMEFDHGKLTLVKGPSGSGKSLIAEIIAGLEYPEITLLEQNQYGQKNFNKTPEKIGFMEQKSGIFSNNIFEAIYLKVEITNSEKERVRDLVINNDLFKFLQNRDLDEFDVNELSGGEFQRIILIRSLLNQKPVMVFDEPASALDHKNSLMMYEIIRKISKKSITILISHDDFVEGFADKIYWL